MKKLLIVLGLLVLTGCVAAEESEKGDYTPGTYFGYEVMEGERANVKLATIVVNEDGFIESVFLDATYNKDGVPHTKKALGDDYNMKPTSANIGVIEGGAEWFEQANSLEAKVLEEQGLDWLTWVDEEETTTDAVSGVTMRVNGLVKAIEKALEEAK